MSKEVFYIKLERNVELDCDSVCVKDLGKFYCKNTEILNRAKTLELFRFQPEDGGRKVISVMYLIDFLQERFQNLDFENIGEAEVVAERVSKTANTGAKQILLVSFVCGICFFGSAFTLIAFHNDIAIGKVFERIYSTVTGQAYDGIGILEIAYSIGLALGIIVFFNHVGGRRITKDPTPIEVEMRIYEDQVNTALVETADREGKTMDVR